ncbi:alkyl/aryl-sulfatase [Serratia sp. DD3]|uniref:alkyl/aryl-sulfatase n=1 Tax=Serratia sp. DD3 TaxID=1410619 RepID=UPI0003C4FA56|nr:alkyl sulfatase dimerization domain-containing protein [Serratia sp. DD3]KEY58539.1 metallo-beta-lactamase superfamily protein [Serratia sp. DD3]
MKLSKIAQFTAIIIAANTFNLAYAAGDGGPTNIKTSNPDVHFHPQGKLPSQFTVDLYNQAKKSLPFEDTRDFEESQKGFIAKPTFTKIMADAGNVAWDMGSYEFLLQGKDFTSINPSLQRQAILNMAYGLYEVVPDRIYQVRGFDLANMTFIKGDTGWIIFDPLTTRETAAAGLAFVNEKLGKRPVVGVVISHSHGDHFGGVRGVVSEADVTSGKIPLIAPEGFVEAAISENVFAGNAMARRFQYQYAVLLDRSPFGHVDQAIGKNVAVGNTGLLVPNRFIKNDFEEITIDGVKMVFQNTPDTEAPVEMNTYFPQFKAFWAAENVTGTIHNIYTLRGAPVRNALNWSKQINKALHKFGDDAQVMFASHSWPRWGNDRIKEVLRAQRDLYANMNNQVLHYANQGVTINEIHNIYQAPPSLQRQWAARSYHGSEEHNSRAIINRFIGYWDGNPATLTPLSPRESAPLYVEMMGGAAKILAKGKELNAQGKYLETTEILNKLVYAEPKNQDARNLLADAYEQLGYQKESTSLRNSFLQGAYELRTGIPQALPPRTTGPDVIRAMPTSLWLDFLGISMDSKKAEGMGFTINLVTPDNKERYLIEMSNATLTNIADYQAKNPTLTITLNRTDLDNVMMGATTFEALEKEGKVKMEGDRSAYSKLKGTLTRFTPDFEIIPGTVNARPTPASNVNSKTPRDNSNNPFEYVIYPSEED